MLQNNIYNKIGFNQYTSEGVLNVPEGISHIKLDIGLSTNAPNSKLWLDTLKDRLVVGFEPCPFNIEILKKRGFMEYKNFFLIETALDNIEEPHYDKFYVTDTDTGCSSLYKPTGYLKYKIDRVIEVPVISLKCFLEIIPWNRFPFIEHIKIDTQGKDLSILKSIEGYLDKVAFINTESTTFNHYEKESYDDSEKIDELLLSYNFECFDKIHAHTDGWNGVLGNYIVDKKYLNKKYKDIIETLNYEVA
jgi:FkbM family methyltransferase